MFSISLTQQRKRTTSWQAEDDGWRVREGRQHSKKVGKMSGMILSIKEQWRKPRKAPPCSERTLKTPLPKQGLPSSRDEEGQWVAMEDRRRRRVAFEETARSILRYRENSEDLKARVTELQEQLGMSEVAGISIRQVAQQARNENGQFFEIFRQGEEDVFIASLDRWNAAVERSG